MKASLIWIYLLSFVLLESKIRIKTCFIFSLYFYILVPWNHHKCFDVRDASRDICDSLHCSLLKIDEIQQEQTPHIWERYYKRKGIKWHQKYCTKNMLFYKLLRKKTNLMTAGETMTLIIITGRINKNRFVEISRFVWKVDSMS